VALRHAMAQLLGYRNHAEYAIAIRMAKSPSKVKEFLESISKRISVLAAKELTKLRAMKVKKYESNKTLACYSATKLRIIGFWVIDLNCGIFFDCQFRKLRKAMTCLAWRIYGITSVRQKKKSLKSTMRQSNNTFLWLLLLQAFFKCTKIC
jgi:Zn-dependent oligopeptidase